MAEPTPYKLPFAARQDVARKLAKTCGLTQIYALQLVNETLRILREGDSYGLPPESAPGVPGLQRITEVPSTDAHETVAAMYRALCRGHEREAQALARYYLGAKHAAGVGTCDGSRDD